MAKLTTNEKQILEKFLKMDGGYVLNFVNRTFEEFFKDDVGINIYDNKYIYGSGSKANQMRGFWQVSDDITVGKAIGKLVEYVDNQILLCNLDKNDFSIELKNRVKSISNHLLGVRSDTSTPVSEDEFLSQDIKSVGIDKLKLYVVITLILKQLIDEIRKCLSSKASLAVIFLCGSTLEGILLGIASTNTKEFNQAVSSPKDKTGKVKHFSEWSLADFINVARELDFLGEDVKKFSHAMRDFRNYIHPYQQMSSNFTPD